MRNCASPRYQASWGSSSGEQNRIPGEPVSVEPGIGVGLGLRVVPVVQAGDINEDEHAWWQASACNAGGLTCWWL